MLQPTDVDNHTYVYAATGGFTPGESHAIVSVHILAVIN